MDNTVQSFHIESSLVEDIALMTQDMLTEIMQFKKWLAQIAPVNNIDLLLSTLSKGLSAFRCHPSSKLGAMIGLYAHLAQGNSFSAQDGPNSPLSQLPFASLEDALLDVRGRTLIQSCHFEGDLLSSIALISVAIRDVNALLNANSIEQREQALIALRMIQSHEILTAASHLLSAVDHNIKRPNLYDRYVEQTVGHIGSVHRLGFTIYYYLCCAKIITELLDCLASFPTPYAKRQLPYDPISAPVCLEIAQHCTRHDETYLASGIKKNLAEWLMALSLCRNEYKEYLKQYIQTALLPSINVERHKMAANIIVTKLTERWEMLDFLVIVYDKVTGIRKHAMVGLKAHECGYQLFSQSTPDGRDINILVAWVPKSQEARGSQCSTRVHYLHEYYLFNDKDDGTVDAKTCETHFDGNAENFRGWSDLKDIFNSFTDTPLSPNRFLWTAKKNLGVARAQSNDARLRWVQGKYLTMAIFE